MRPLGKYLNLRDQRSAQNVYGSIVSRNADGSYQCLRFDTNETVRATRAIEGQEYERGQTVIMARDNAINKHVGYAIIGLPGLAAQNTNSNPPTEEEFEYGAAISGSVSVEQGSSGTLTISGTWLTGSVALEATATGTTLAVVSQTKTSIVCTITAGIQATAGSYDVTVGPLTLTDGVTITTLDDQLWLGFNYSTGGSSVQSMDRYTGAALLSGTLSGLSWTLADGGPLWMYVAVAGGPIARVAKASATLEEKTPTGRGTTFATARQVLAHDGTYLWCFGSSERYLLQYDFHNGTIIQTVDLGALRTAYMGVYAFGYLWVTSSHGLQKINTTTGAVVTTVIAGLESLIANDSTYLYVEVAGVIKQIDPSDVSVVASSADLGDAVAIAVAGGYVYVSCSDRYVRVLDCSDMSTLATSDLFGRDLQSYAGVAAKQTLVWVSIDSLSGANPAIYRLNPTTLAIEVTVNRTATNSRVLSLLLA